MARMSEPSPYVEFDRAQWRMLRRSRPLVLTEEELIGLRGNALRRVRGEEIAVIFQEPMTALNPVYTVGQQIVETIRLHRDLPPWMVPAHIDILSALPRGDRGKVDRMALPRPHRIPFQSPCGADESAVAELWAQVLRVDTVGRADSFYALGGDSLTVAQMLVELRESHGVALQPSDLAAAPTLAEFAQRLGQRRPADHAGQPDPGAIGGGLAAHHADDMGGGGFDRSVHGTFSISGSTQDDACGAATESRAA